MTIPEPLAHSSVALDPPLSHGRISLPHSSPDRHVWTALPPVGRSNCHRLFQLPKDHGYAPVEAYEGDEPGKGVRRKSRFVDEFHKQMMPSGKLPVVGKGREGRR